ncbi:hypothetical protein DFH28DRAFT_584298 [Melampsora americana]|nr:hypothetical protein DFH28DRAFT_584298 [Melampsora americana]
MSEEQSEISKNTTEESSITLKDDHSSDQQLEEAEEEGNQVKSNLSFIQFPNDRMMRFDHQSLTSAWLEGVKKDLVDQQKVLKEMKQVVSDFELWLETGMTQVSKLQENLLNQRLSMIENLEIQQIEDHQALENAVNQMISIESLLHPHQTQ